METQNKDVVCGGFFPKFNAFFPRLIRQEIQDDVITFDALETVIEQ